MQAEFFMTKPEDMEATLSITMTLAQWKILKDELRTNSYDAMRSHLLHREIVTLIETVQKHFHATHKKE